jgi:hypothetical protein
MEINDMPVTRKQTMADAVTTAWSCWHQVELSV